MSHGCGGKLVRFGNALKYVNLPKKSMDLLPTMPALRILVTNTRVPKNTKALVAGVRVLHDALPAVVDPILSAINEISLSFVGAIGPGADPAALHGTIAKLVRINHSLLCGLGVGHPALDTLCAITARCV